MALIKYGFNNLTKEQRNKLTSLWGEAREIEKTYDLECQKLLANLFENKTQKTQHGDYIKLYYKTIHGSTLISMKNIPEEVMDCIANVYATVAIESSLVDSAGLEALMREIQLRMFSQEKDQTYGNLVELSNVAQIADTLANAINAELQKYGFQSYKVKVVDTSPKNDFGESILYDIRLEITDLTTGETMVLPPMESKSGIYYDYTRSHFHFGDFSSTGLALNPNAYKDLIETLRENFWQYISTVYYDTTNDDFRIKLSIYHIVMDWAIEYICWKLRSGGFPIFIGRYEQQVNLCSEIIYGFLTGMPGGEVETVISELFDVVVGALTTNRQFSTRWSGSFRDYNIADLSQEKYNVFKQWVQTGNRRLYAKELIDWIFENKSIYNIMPNFTTSVWYGKR